MLNRLVATLLVDGDVSIVDGELDIGTLVAEDVRDAV